jgi:hypothetical protein
LCDRLRTPAHDYLATFVTGRHPQPVTFSKVSPDPLHVRFANGFGNVAEHAHLGLRGSVWAVVEGYRLYRQVPYEYDGELTVTEVKRFDDGSHFYDVSFDIEIKNLSKSQIAISYSFAELYLGDTKADGPKVGEAITLNDMPDPWHHAPTGPISWTRRAYEADLADGDTDQAASGFVHQHSKRSPKAAA